MGGVAGELSGMQGTLNAIRQEVKGEYDTWKAKRKIHVEEREILQKQVNHLEAFINKRKALRAEKAHLQQILPTLADKAQAFGMAFVKGREKWEVEKKTFQMDLDSLRGQIQANKTVYAMLLAEQENATAVLANRSDGLHLDVNMLDLQLGSAQNLSALQRLNATTEQVNLSQQVQALLKEIKALRADATSQAKIRSKVYSEHDRLAKQASQVMAQRQKLQGEAKECESRLKLLDEKIGATRQAFSASKKELLACKAVEGESAKLQEKLNICKAGQRAGR